MLTELNDSLAYINHQTIANLPFLQRIIVVFWGVYFLNLLMQNRLLRLGIIPRHLIGLRGIIFAPFLHANSNHLFFNSIPLLVLSNFILMDGLSAYLWVSGSIALISGCLIWCFAKTGIHIGASAVITGYWAYLVSGIMQQSSVTAVILGIICLYYFAGIFLGIFPSQRGVSWEGHLFGLLAGIVTRFFLPFFWAFFYG